LATFQRAFSPESLDELNSNLREVVELLREEGEPSIEAQFVGTQLVTVE